MSDITDVVIEVANGYEHMAALLRDLPRTFGDEDNQPVFAARNVLKVINLADVDCMVKSFQVVHPMRRVLYTCLRESKAKRSFTHSQKLKSLGIGTPEPIGYVEFYRNGVLHDSYYVSKNLSFDFEIRALLAEPNGPLKDAMEPLTKFTAYVHDSGVLHTDFTPGNVLVKREGNDFKFYMVDVNRMQFGLISAKKGIQNIARLLELQALREPFINSYAQYRGIDKNYALALINEYADKAVKFHQRKKQLKNLLR